MASISLVSSLLTAAKAGAQTVGSMDDGDDDEGNVDDDGDKERNFWKRPDRLGNRLFCQLNRGYKRTSLDMVKDRANYVMIVVLSSGTNHRRNQIFGAVMIARIHHGPFLVLPILQVNVIWGDEIESEFSDICDLEHFKEVLVNDVRMLLSLPSTHAMTKRVEEKMTRLYATPPWITSWFHRKVAFHGLRFPLPILDLGNKLTKWMRCAGSIHLLMGKDVWVRSGSRPGLSHEYDDEMIRNNKQRPELLTSRSNMAYHERKLFCLAVLNALEIKRLLEALGAHIRLLKALGAAESARIFWARGNTLQENKYLAFPGELEPFQRKASLMAAIGYLVSANSDIFNQSHGGNMGHTIQISSRSTYLNTAEEIDLLNGHDVHIHSPVIAVPKDGPSRVVELPGTDGETNTQGLNDLAKRCQQNYAANARFSSGMLSRLEPMNHPRRLFMRIPVDWTDMLSSASRMVWCQLLSQRSLHHASCCPFCGVLFWCPK
ncbi:OLC1v1024136C1 [Oldenlandia corymbosa var. corymbosa]|uniref:fructose-bisphosphate aldolase n=1 Tax=Oldenlandia corymbosa var. corymbosa TaxID=529605 RepID=A0AAV1C1M4_OLDCO|nr:OLC1v1024136C1 [Oldenlandia corymbosa var. corymbosa]